MCVITYETKTLLAGLAYVVSLPLAGLCRTEKLHEIINVSQAHGTYACCKPQSSGYQAR